MLAAGNRELVAVWALHLLFVALTFVTYARLDPQELYNVSRDGLAGGASRALVEVNYPLALAAIAIIGICAGRLGSRPAAAAALAGVALCAAVPFVVDKSDLDARPANLVPAAGVVVAGVLTVLAIRRRPAEPVGPLRGDRVRVVLAAATAVMSIPWYFAEAGFYAPDPILADEPSPAEPIAAVHLGSHHGTEGAVLLVSALLLSRLVPPLPLRTRAWVSSALALMLAYGAAIAVEDFWHEQVVKRGSSSWKLPDMTLPSLSAGWLGIVVAAVLVEVLWFRRERRAADAVAEGGVPAPR